MTQPTILQWSIIGPGGIARTFTRNLLQYLPSSRGADDIAHRITAVASSTSLSTAQSFIDQNVTPHQQSVECTAHTSYPSLVQDPNIDIVYIATPHSSHFRNAMLALTNDKPVLCEKPLYVNAKQAEIVTAMASQRGLFLMKAVWARFFPISLFVQDMIRQGKVGEIIRVSADFSMGCGDQKGTEEMFGEGADNRMVNPDFAVYRLLPPHLQTEPNLAGATMTPFTPPNPISSQWVDASTTLLLTLPSSPSGTSTCHAVASTSLYINTDSGYGGDNPRHKISHQYSTPSVRIQGTKGEFQLFGPLPRPQRLRLFTAIDSTTDGGEIANTTLGNAVNAPSNRGYHVEDHVFGSRGDGTGMFWEADEVARCLRGRKLQSEIMPWEETVMVLRVMDRVRESCGLAYPSGVEGVEL